jgi:signal transduction histidine kinase
VRERVAELLEWLPRPLDPVRSIKLKLGILLVCSGAAAFLFFRWQIGWLPPRTTLTAIVLGLLTSQVLAHGMTRPLREMTAAAHAMARGNYSLRVRATARDEVGQLAAAFNQMAADLAAADRQRRELIANVSHELRTPIAALRAVLENVVDGVADTDPATMATALRQTERLSTLVAELLDLSRLDAGVAELTRTEFPVAPLLADVVAEAEAARGDVRFSVDVVPADATVFADRGRLHQVVANLVDNAVRHGPAGGQVRVRARGSGNELVLEVRDEGPGIPVVDRERVFERFVRGERAGGGGTGLGLAIARWAVDLHGGTIAVVEPDAVDAADAVDVVGPSGCRIRVTLPATT